MTYEPVRRRPGRRPRLTGRGRLVLMAGAVLVIAAAVLVPVLIDRGSEGPGPGRLVVPEGQRAAQVYASVDRALGLAAGTTREKAASVPLDLPPAARDNPEGYLFPATYPVNAESTPASLLSFMVNTANQRFGAHHISDGARLDDVSVYQTVTLASIVQAEAATASDMGKVSRVIHNRLARGMALQMDSTINYGLRRSTLDTTYQDTGIDSPYNTYERKGLPPTPIGNPGNEALNAAVRPTRGNWLYFVTVAPGDTRFTASYAEQRRNVAEFNANRRAASRTG
ncbi:endolytic transglycosylase MltG [Streptomyces liangshanensis]|uniref:Endolytic murein transglycosylase n=1 Tax=Streptomyces liangshanensis TaxID=2717324 RepID=A0A6G9H6G6_9ACTN|nr:endolytic transglycosylase MltG [Streptomyces liangshanensis]QIQ06034.1 endolytic transglycosylase MltG [Streptomyces liangshanensis]